MEKGNSVLEKNVFVAWIDTIKREELKKNYS